MRDDDASRMRSLFEAALELPEEQRDAFLRQQCAEDGELRSAVEAMLRQDAQLDTSFLKSPLRRPAPGDQSPASSDDAFDGTPQEIGRYRITRRIGVGGMGVVYEGTQEAPNRSVAIKVIRPEIVSPHTLARFRTEAEILGMLEHRGIARIYEAGAIEVDGAVPRPFFAMELVRGTPLLEHACDLTTERRLGLFAEICDAVHHAHQKGVIHRDLKPANILVTSDGQPKILDFGVALATDGDIQAATMLTDVGQLLGTLPYMSPEQVAGHRGSIDTRSDVYALGVVLFELLTGARPHDVRQESLPEAARIIRDEEATRLSSVMPTLRGELEWMVGKALEKDIAQRYDSASAFAADVRRYLAHEPVLAGPPSGVYLMRKFAQRHRAGVVWAAVAVLMLAGGLAVAIAQAMRATRAEHATRIAFTQAQREADRALAGRDFLLWSLGRSNIGAQGADEHSLRTTLDLASGHIGERFEGRPEAELEVRRLMGNVYEELSAYASAREHLIRAHELLRERDGNGPPESVLDADLPALVEVLLQLNMCERELGRGEEAAARWYWEAADLAQAHLGRRDTALGEAIADMRRHLITSKQPLPAVMDAHLARTLAAWEAAMAPDDHDGFYVAVVLNLVATNLGNRFMGVPIPYMRACNAIMSRLDGERTKRFVTVALWMEARSMVPTGDEEHRVEIARQLMARCESGDLKLWFAADSMGVLGDALLQRGREQDADEISNLLIGSHQAMRALQPADDTGHMLLVRRRALAMMRLAGVGLPGQDQDGRVIHLVDRPALLDELTNAIEIDQFGPVLALMAQSMSGREGRSDRWYEVGQAAGARAALLSSQGGSP